MFAPIASVPVMSPSAVIIRPPLPGVPSTYVAQRPKLRPAHLSVTHGAVQYRPDDVAGWQASMETPYFRLDPTRPRVRQNDLRPGDIIDASRFGVAVPACDLGPFLTIVMVTTTPDGYVTCVTGALSNGLAVSIPLPRHSRRSVYTFARRRSPRSLAALKLVKGGKRRG